MMSDIAITQAECIFILIDNAVIKDDELDKLMTNLYMKEYDLYCYIMWLLNRWARGLRKHKFHLPTHKKKISIVLIAVFQCNQVIIFADIAVLKRSQKLIYARPFNAWAPNSSNSFSLFFSVLVVCPGKCPEDKIPLILSYSF